MKMTGRRFGIALLLIIILPGGCRKEQSLTSLPRSVPEAEGVSSQGIIDFLDAAAKSKHEFHSIMFLRHGKVIAEGWWSPYRSDLRHTLYSTSKSFTATAVGFAVSEKKLSVNDRVISFFPDALPDTVSKFLAEMRVRDLLSMSAGQDPDPTIKVVTRDSNWVKSFLALPVVHEPGTKFLYNTLATYMLSAIVQKATGEKVMDFLKPRLFDPLAINGADWEVDPLGINTGGWGLRLKTEDMAKFGQLFLQKGKWNGKQVLPAAWIEEASTKKIDQNPDAPQSAKDSSDWLQGYCYQMWRCRHNGFRADGAYGQYIIIMPEQDAVIAVQCESPDMQGEINLIWEYLLPAIKTGTLPENNPVYTTLKNRLSSLALPLPAKGNGSAMAAQISGKRIELLPNEKHIESIDIQFTGNSCKVSMMIDSRNFDFTFGSGQWIEGETTLHGPNLLMPAKAHFAALPPEKIAGSYTWKDENTLEMVLRYIESPHTETITCQFDKNTVSVGFHYSNEPTNTPPELKGVVKLPEYSITLSDSVIQPITGWGCFPGFIDWGARIGYDKSLQKAIYGDLGMTVVRVKIYPHYCNSDGSLNTKEIDKNLAKQLETMKSYGLTKWIITTWSPPTFMKIFNDTIGNVNGQPNHLKPEYEDAFVKFYVKVLVYLRDVKKLGTPVYATVQNEVDYAAPWDGCPYEPVQWQRVTKKLRKELDSENLRMVKIHGPDHNHYTIGKYLGPDLSALRTDPELLKAMDGIAFHSYDEGTQSGGKAAVEARDLILKFKNELKKGNEIWQTENCTVKPEDLTVSAIRQLRSMMRDIGYLEANCYIYWLGASDNKSYSGEELIFSGTRTKLYYVFQKLWKTVIPGQFSVVNFSKNDAPDLSSFGPDPMDMIAFTGNNRTVVLLTNPTATFMNIKIKGLPGTKAELFRSSGSEDMADIGSKAISNGETTVSMPAVSILILETNRGK
jgi:O-glycosyl hydrolase